MKHRPLLLFLFLAIAAFSATQAAAQATCTIFPADNVWNTPVDTLPVDPNSATYVSTIGADRYLHPDFGAGLYAGAPMGIPYNIVPGTQPKVAVSFDYADESDPGPYPIPPNAAIEGGASSTGDRHVLVLDKDNCLLYETWSSYPQPDGSWRAGSGAIFNLKSNALRPSGWTSADAAGLPVLPGLARHDEVAAGEIRHALRFTVPQTRRAFAWPARHFASTLTGTNYPPMGQRFRLKASFDISTFSPETQVILRALKKYGMILADNGSAWYISGAPDNGWNNDVLVSEFARVHGSDFEAVDESSLIIDPKSGQARQTVAGADTVAPTAPASLVATPKSSSQIDLSWSPATDNVGVQGYLVYRNGSQIASVTGTSFQNVGLQGATTYSYQVVAFDAAGNRSASSATVSATTAAASADTTPPSVPSGVAAKVMSSTQISLTWKASTDNKGVAGYRVFRNGALATTVGGTSYLDSQLTPGSSYSYAVAAFDTAGNTSAKSASVTRTTWPPPSTKFNTGGGVKTVASTSVRAQPGGAVLGTQPTGALGKVIGGPSYYNGNWWWNIDFSKAPDGWVNEGRIAAAP